MSGQEIEVEGIVCPQGSDIGMPGVSVHVKNENIGVTTDASGRYRLSANVDSTLVFSCLGFMSQEVAIEGRTLINVCLVQDIYELDSIVVSTTNRRMDISDGRIVVHLDRYDTKGKLLSEVMSKMPTIKVTEDGIKMFGKESVLVYINNHEVRLEGESLVNYLNSFPSEIVSTVEIMSSSLTEYDANGNIGIIKLNMSRNVNPGLRGQILTGYTRNHYNSGLVSSYIDYSGKHFYFNADVNGSIYQYCNSSSYSSLFPNAVVSTDNPMKWRNDEAMLALSSGYNFNDGGNLSANIQLPLYANETVTDLNNETHYINRRSQALDSLMTSMGTAVKDTRQYDFDVYYDRPVGNAHLYAAAGYARNVVGSSRDWVSTTSVPGPAPLTDTLFSTGTLLYDIWTAKIDFSFPFIGFEAKVGYKFSNVNTSSVNRMSSQLNDNQNNLYSYWENVNAGYFSMKRKMDSFSLSLGLRCEYSSTTGKTNTATKGYDAAYCDFFPSLSVSYRNDDNIVSVSYDRRINRPRFQDLDPFRWYISKYDYTEGNPFLKPSYINNVEVNYLFSDVLSCKGYFTAEKNAIGRFVLLDSLNINRQVQAVDNFMNKNSVGFSTDFYTPVKDWLDVNLSAEVSYTHYKSNSKSLTNTSGWDIALNASLDFYPNDRWTIFVKVDECPPGLYNFRIMGNSFRMDVGGIYTDPHNRFYVKLSFKDIFKSSSPTYYYYCNGIKQTYDNYYDTRSVSVSFSWKFGNWHINGHDAATSSGTDERDRL